jgi:hypothetical protein
MVGPDLQARVKQRHDGLRRRVDPREIWPLLTNYTLGN